MKKDDSRSHPKGLPKSPTGIQGLDEITHGGLPKGRPTLICGNAGCGKTLLAMEFLVRGATLYNEPGVFMAFEETEKDLTENVSSLGFDLTRMTAEKKILLDHVHVERSEIEETGEYDLEGLFIRLNHAIDSLGAKRVVLDTIETLFAGLPNDNILRAELRRLFRFLKEKGVTAIITGERGEGALTRHGLEEYVSDCVILLDNRVTEESSTRLLRIIKYRGSQHGTNEYPFLIEEKGFSVFPITSVGLAHTVSSERISSGVPRLDTMLSGGGYYRGSSILVSGTAGSGKSSLSAHFASAACQRGEHVLYFALEESPSQIMRNMRSIGLDLGEFVDKGVLRFHSRRPTFSGLESHLTIIHKEVADFKPRVVIIDPVSSFMLGNSGKEARSMVMRLVDFLKANHITAFMTNLTRGDSSLEHTDVNISSLIDTWLLLRDIEIGGERNRGMFILKSRGMSHSNQIREFRLTDQGVQLLDVYVGPGGVLTGSARITQEETERAEQLHRQQEGRRKELELERKRRKLESHIEALRAEFEEEEQESLRAIATGQQQTERQSQVQDEMVKSRKGDTNEETAIHDLNKILSKEQV